MLPGEWELQLPGLGVADTPQLGACRRIEDACDRLVPLGQGTYGEAAEARAGGAA